MPPRPDRIQALLIVAATLLVAQLLLGFASRTAQDPLLQLSLHAAITEVILLGLALAGGRLSRRGPRDALGLRSGRLRGPELVLLALGTLAASHALDGLAHLTDLSDDSALRELPEMLAGAEGLRLAAALLAIGLAPAVAEELLCRGLVQRSLVRRFGPGTGILGASLVFGALHVDPVHAGFAGVLGVYLGIAARWDDSSRAPALCHAVNNSAGVLALSASGAASMSATPVSVGLGAALALACLLRVARARRRPDPDPDGLDPAGPEVPSGPGAAAELQPGRQTDDA